ncbi:MAG: type III-A CRISPR-associated protein Csm2 [Anaerolineae bacterium]|nr:type III-A CRISPR-associated protein Csm2 [Anaerolineae bacterium]
MALKTINPIPKNIMSKIIQEGDAQELVTQADKWGTQFGKKPPNKSESAVSANQIRAIFGTVRRIEMNWPTNTDGEGQSQAKRDFRLLQPKIIYRAAREKAKEFQQFSAIMVDAIDLVLADDSQARQRFGHFVDFFEAIMAYHKAASEGVSTVKEGQGERR